MICYDSCLVALTRNGLQAEHMHKDDHMFGFNIISWQGCHFTFLNTKHAAVFKI